MVYPDDIVELPGAFYPSDPPPEAVLFHLRVIVDGVAPKLPVIVKCIGRAPGDDCREILVVQQEEMRLAPYIRGVQRHIYGHVPDYFYSLRVHIVLKRVPLLIKQKLKKDIEVHIFPEHISVFIERRLFSEAYILIRPFCPALHAEMCFYSHKKSVVSDPGGVFFSEFFYSFFIALPAVTEGFSQDFETALEYPAVVRFLLIPAPVGRFQVFFINKSVLCQHIGVDIIRVSGKG